MIYHLAFVLFAPILYIQGKYVKRVTPKLPEPEGVRVGQAGAGRQMCLLIVGDSAAAGVGVEQQSDALSGHVVSSLSAEYSVVWKVFAQSGDSSRQLLEKLQMSPSERFESVVVSIGVNDITALTSSSVWVNNLECIVAVLKTKFDARRVYLSSVPPMHLFPALPNPLRWWLGLRARQFNGLMKAVAERDSNCDFLAIPYPSDLGFIAQDGFHPGARAYKLWGEHVAEVIHRSVSDR
ncbi:MAG: SGNH/GDSL hydrolase family protein [Oceanococcus sp.]